MMFSKRNGIVGEKLLQKDEIDQSLRNKLWTISKDYLSNVSIQRIPNGIGDFDYEIRGFFIERLSLYFGFDIDKIPSGEYVETYLGFVKSIFFSSDWYLLYDFIEFLFTFLPVPEKINEYNTVLESENSAYRVTKDGKIIEISNYEELSSINESMKNKYDSVKKHLETAIQHFSNRDKPDYRNTIKESISSVEAMCRIIVGDDNATLGSALKKLKDSGLNIHSALKEGFEKIYGYTSDESGIRHSLVEGSIEPDFNDAKYMLVSCSAFVNYLTILFEKIK